MVELWVGEISAGMALSHRLIFPIILSMTKYVDIIDYNAIPTLQQHYKTDNCFNQADNAQCHRSEIFMQQCEDAGVTLPLELQSESYSTFME